MYIVTGAAGFIGSHVVKALNERGANDLLLVDDLTEGDKFRNLADRRFADYMDIEELLDALATHRMPAKVEAIFHQGACADTMESDGRYMMERNVYFSKKLLHYALRGGIPFVYASSASIYGTNRASAEVAENEAPPNLYAFSKYAFDQHVRALLPHLRSTVVGLRYFNVYGPREVHKGRMASMVFQLYKQLKTTGACKLFKGTDGFGDGEQRRDFVHADDCAAVNLFFADGGPHQGIYNVGAGASRSFNEVFAAIRDLLGSGELSYIPFPDKLRGKYQSFTEADLTNLRAAGCDTPFRTLEEGLRDCASVWDERLAMAGALSV